MKTFALPQKGFDGSVGSLLTMFFEGGVANPLTVLLLTTSNCKGFPGELKVMVRTQINVYLYFYIVPLCVFM